MKKVILSIAMAAFLGLGLVSCDKDQRKCYKFTYEVEILGAKTEITTYEWCSANEADAKKDALCLSLGITLIRIKENDYLQNKDNMLSFIKNIILERLNV